MKKKILFVCSANKQRSKTCEDYFSTLYPDCEFKSAGTNLKICNAEGTNPLTDEMLDWADTIFVMENRHAQLIMRNSANKYRNKIFVLAIVDRYKYFQKELIDLLNSKTKFIETVSLM